LVRNLGPVERLLHLEHGVLALLQKDVEPADDDHREDYVAVFAADVVVAEHVVRDSPDEVDDLVVLGVVHVVPYGFGRTDHP
jgi:hypothetical protein